MAEEIEVAVLAARFDAHEKGCDARMIEIKATFEEVKDMNKTTHTLMISQLLGLLGGAIVLIVAIVTKQLGLT